MFGGIVTPGNAKHPALQVSFLNANIAGVQCGGKQVFDAAKNVRSNVGHCLLQDEALSYDGFWMMNLGVDRLCRIV